MKYLKSFEANFTKKVKNMFKNDIYYINKNDYIYPDGYSRYFQRGDTVIYTAPENTYFGNFHTGDVCRILRMEGQNAKVINTINDKIEVLSLQSLLSKEDYELNRSTNKYNL